MRPPSAIPVAGALPLPAAVAVRGGGGEVRVLLPLDAAVRWLGRIAAFLVAAFLATQYVSLELGQVYVFGLVPLFDLSGDGNLPRLFQALLLAASGLAFLAIGADRTGAEPGQSRRWVFLGALLLCLALDEAVQLEARMSLLVSAGFGRSAGSHLAAASGLGSAVAAFWLAPLAATLDRATLRPLLFAGAAAAAWMLCDRLAVAVGDSLGFVTFEHAVFVAAGKGFRMAAAILLLQAALDHLKRRNTTLRVLAG